MSSFVVVVVFFVFFSLPPSSSLFFKGRGAANMTGESQASVGPGPRQQPYKPEHLQPPAQHTSWIGRDQMSYMVSGLM